MKRCPRTVVRALSLLVLVVALPALAENVEGQGAVFSRDLTRGTVQIGDKTLHVTANTRIVDKDGRRLTLGELPLMPQAAPGLFRLDPRAMVRYTAESSARGLEARSIEVVGEVRD